MAQARHVVVAGDTLWDISRTYLGDPRQWPRIWRYNNRRSVMAITGRGIVNPDRIFPGQTLLMPIAPGVGVHHSRLSGTIAPAMTASSAAGVAARLAPSHESGHHPHPQAEPSAQPLRNQRESAEQGPLSRQLKLETTPVAFRYKMEDIKAPPVVTPQAIIEVRATGMVTLVSKKAVPSTYVSQRDIEVAVTQSANHAFGELVSKVAMIYEPGTNKLTLRSMLVSNSQTPNIPTVATGIQMDSHNPIPKLRFEIRLPKLQGQIKGFLYQTSEITYVIEVTPTPQRPPNGVPVGLPVPSAQPVRSPGIDWGRVVGVALITGAAVDVIASVVEDFCTGGAGIVDDPVTFAAAEAMYTRGVTMLRSAASLRTAGVVAARALTTANLRLVFEFSIAPSAVGAFAH